MPEFPARLQPIDEFVDRLKNDFDSILRDELRCKGFNPDGITDCHDLMIAYGSLKARHVSSHPRRVHLNRALQIETSLRKGFNRLMEKFAHGENVNPHLSRLSARVDARDAMFYDWGINHFHLGTVVERDGFVNRTGPVAYAIVRSNDVYIITVAPHGAWSDISMIETVDNLWPELIEGWRINGTFDIKMTDDTVKAMRKAGITAGISLPNGHSYISPGGGYSCSGVSLKAVMEANKMIHRFRDYHRHLDNKLIITADDQYVAEHGLTIEIRLKRVNNDLMLYTPGLDWEYKILEFYPLPF